MTPVRLEAPAALPDPDEIASVANMFMEFSKENKCTTHFIEVYDLCDLKNSVKV